MKRFPFSIPDDDEPSPLRLTITLYPPGDRGTLCHACGAECAVRYGLPVDERGQYVENSYEGEWGGVPACHECFDAHAKGGVVGLEIRLRAVTLTRRAADVVPRIASEILERYAPVIGEVRAE
ncbi:MAG TPA: hypothetical protein VH439_17485 [Gemmatimonadales bacterium]|jgi:hypothetical protein